MGGSSGSKALQIMQYQAMQEAAKKDYSDIERQKEQQLEEADRLKRENRSRRQNTSKRANSLLGSSYNKLS